MGTGRIREFNWRIWVAFGSILLLSYIPISGNRQWMNIAILSFLYIALGQSWNLLSGLAGLFSISHAIFFGMGAYGVTVTITRLHGTLWTGVMMGLLLSAIMAFLVGLIGGRLSEPYFTMALIGINQTVYTLALQLFSITGGSGGISLPRDYLLSKQILYGLAIILAAGATVLFFLIRRSRWGTNLVALKDNPKLAISLGVNVAAWRILATVVSGAMAAVCGAFYSLHMMSNNPEVFSGTISLKIIMVAVVGGLGSLWGPILGISLVILDEYVRGAMPSNLAPLSVVVYALVLILVLLLRPKGMVSMFLKRRNSQNSEKEG